MPSRRRSGDPTTSQDYGSQGRMECRGCTLQPAPLGGRLWAASVSLSCLMHRRGLQGAMRRKGTFHHRAPTVTRNARPDLAVPATSSLRAHIGSWVADITYIPTWARFLYLAIVLDAWSRRVVGWAMETHLRTQLVLERAEHGALPAPPQRAGHPSTPDQGCQHTSIAFGKRCDEARKRAPSMGSVSDAYDRRPVREFLRHVGVPAS